MFERKFRETQDLNLAPAARYKFFINLFFAIYFTQVSYHYPFFSAAVELVSVEIILRRYHSETISWKYTASQN